ncbi:MAG: MscL family protein [Bifidobacterium pseudocatenulatum]
MIEGFKKFIARGNMIDMAVGVVMGGAVTTVVNSIVNNVINPFIAMIFGKPNMGGLLAITFNNATVSFGAVLGAILNFLIIAAAVYFCILVPINKFRDVTEALLAKTKLAEERSKAEEEDAKEPEISTEEQTILLLQQIRDELAKQNARNTQNVPNDSDTVAGAVAVR